MNADDVLKYGHLTVLGAVDGLAPNQWETPGACGVWSVKDIIAHLASYELVLIDICQPFLGDAPTPCLDRYLDPGGGFNDVEVERRRRQTADETLAEYTAAQEGAAGLVAQIPVARRRQPGLLPWYGAEYDLEDLIAYMYYGHKREHCAQIALFRDRPTA